MPNPPVEGDCAKARSLSLLRCMSGFEKSLCLLSVESTHPRLTERPSRYDLSQKNCLVRNGSIAEVKRNTSNVR